MPVNPGDPLIEGNTLRGRSFGGEFSSLIQVQPWWQLRPSYSHLQVHLEQTPGSRAINEGQSEANDPKHQFSLRSYMNFPHRVELDLWMRYISGLPVAVPATAARLPGYTTFDIRLGWSPSDDLEFSIVGQNLPEEQHAEFPSTQQEEVRRGVYGKVRWSF